MSSIRISAAIDQLKTVRGVTKHFLGDLTPDEWFWMPEPAVTHIAWQVGTHMVARLVLPMFYLKTTQNDV